MQKEIRTRRESNDKENKKDSNATFKTHGRLRSFKTEKNVVREDANDGNECNEEQMEEPVEDNKDAEQETPQVNGGHGE